MTATNLVYEFLNSENRRDIICKYSLNPFELNVQSKERTFIDKLFAIGDYYLAGKITGHSRHIYDVYKLSNSVEINESLKELFKTVREERSNHASCLSAQHCVNLKVLLQKIIDESIYKKDYETITVYLLFEEVPYKTAINALQAIISSELFE